MAKGRLIAGALAALLLLAGVAAWRVSSTSDDVVDAPRATSTPVAARPRHHGGGAKETTPPRETPPGKPATPEETDALARLDRVVAGETTDPQEKKTILVEVGRGKAPGGALHEVLRLSTEELAKARDAKSRRRAELRVQWTIDEALAPYRRDRALFAKVYREVRFGDGKLDAAGGSPVREFQFGDAAQRMGRLRPLLETWCYEAAARRAGQELAADEQIWRGFRQDCPRRGWDVPPEPGSPEARTTTPGETARRYVLPHLDDLASGWAWGLLQVFIDEGEPDAAAACADRFRRAYLAEYGDRPETAKWIDALLAPSAAELLAMRDLRDVAPYRVPAEATTLGAWFEKHRTTQFAHAVGLSGDVEIGAWDDAMTKSFLEGGLPWAPEQRQTERERLSKAKSDARDGLAGWTASSPNWEVFTDVSSEFAAEATLVLESGWAQAQIATGVRADHWQPVQARIYKHRADYEAITHDRSSGHWIPGMNSVLCFLDDPARTEFDEFRYPVLVHEATHAALTWGVGGAVPSWMHEGLACYVERWSPVASVAVNERLTRDWLRNGRRLAAAQAAGTLPTLDGLLAVRGDWDVDAFGPVTLTRYAAAESLFVHLSDDAERWKLVTAWIAAARKGADPGATPRPPKRDELAKSWSEFVDAECASLAETK